MSRMNNDQIGHAWFYASEGENGKNGNGSFFFEGDTVYSYGRHFPIARKVERDGVLYVLWNDGSCSVTTSQHQAIVRWAIDRASCRVINLPGNMVTMNRCTELDFNRFAASYLDHARAAFAKAAKCRLSHTIAEARAEAFGYLRQIADAAAFFGRRVPSHINAFSQAMEAAHDKEAMAQVIADSQRKQEATARRKQAKEIREWRATGKGHVRTKYALLRIGKRLKSMSEQASSTDYEPKTKQVIETSQGASLPVASFRRCWSLALHAIRTGETVTDSDLSESCRRALHPYVLHGVDREFIRIGCHTIEIKEAQAIAKALDLEWR